MKLPKNGPKLEISKLSVPKPISDVYRELRGQRLLPVVAVLVIGLIAIPVLVGGSESKPKVARPTLGTGSESAPALTASRWTPGLLDYKERLKFRKAKDPFSSGISDSEESSGSSEAGESSGGEGGGEESGSPIETPSEFEPSTDGSPEPEILSPVGSEENHHEGSKDESEQSEASPSDDAIDVRVTAVHLHAATDQVTVRHNQPRMTKLPTDSLPALTYVGPSEDGTKAQMIVSPDVTALLGASTCIIKADPCQLLALELNAPETLVYGNRGLTYRIELVAIGPEGNSHASQRRSGASPADEVGLSQAHPLP